MSYGAETFKRPPRIFAINPFPSEGEGMRIVYTFGPSAGQGVATYRHPMIDSLPPGAAYKVRFKMRVR